MNGVDGASLLDRIQDKPEPGISLKKYLSMCFFYRWYPAFFSFWLILQ